jgi:hypothetical protein
VKACGHGAVLSHHAAAALWGILEWDGRHPAVTVRRAGGRAHSGIRIHRSSLDARDVTRHRGIPVTSPIRTLIDLAATLPPRPLRRAVRHALALRLVHQRALADRHATAGRRRGVRALRAIASGGAAWHEDPLARADDAERQALLEAHGERVLRVSWRQAVGRPAQTLARIGAAASQVQASLERP